MPKLRDTRKHKAKKLLELATRGPHFERIDTGVPFTFKEAETDYRRWSESWLLPLINELVPELRKKP